MDEADGPAEGRGEATSRMAEGGEKMKGRREGGRGRRKGGRKEGQRHNVKSKTRPHMIWLIFPMTL